MDAGLEGSAFSNHFIDRVRTCAQKVSLIAWVARKDDMRKPVKFVPHCAKSGVAGEPRCSLFAVSKRDQRVLAKPSLLLIPSPKFVEAWLEIIDAVPKGGPLIF